jgi:hypothetical protein
MGIGLFKAMGFVPDLDHQGLGHSILTMNHETWRVGVSLKQIMPLGLDHHTLLHSSGTGRDFF